MEELNKFNIEKKVIEYQQNYLQCILRMPSNQFLRSCLAIILKEEGRGRPPEMEGSVHLTQTTEHVKRKEIHVHVH